MCRFRIERFYGERRIHRFTTYVEEEYFKRYYPKYYKEIVRDRNCVGISDTKRSMFYEQIIVTDLWKTY